MIPFYYKWGTFSNVKATYEYLSEKYDVNLVTKKEAEFIQLNDYNLIMLHGSGTTLKKSKLETYKGKIFGFGWSDPNLFNIIHFCQSDIYFTNDLATYYEKKEYKRVIYYQTSCDKRHHVKSQITKTTDILVYGCGSHKFVTDRNETVNKLRNAGFNIKIFGRGWDNHKDTHEFIEGVRLIEEINKAHILLDLSNEVTAWPHRIFEASACGTPVITINRKDTTHLFQDESEIILYQNYNNLKDILDFIFTKKHFDKLKDIGLNAQKRCYKEHDISIRIKKLISIIEKLKS